MKGRSFWAKHMLNLELDLYRFRWCDDIFYHLLIFAPRPCF